MAAFVESARVLDRGVGAVLDSLAAHVLLLDGPVLPPPGAELNDPDQRSATEPTTVLVT